MPVRFVYEVETLPVSVYGESADVSDSSILSANNLPLLAPNSVLTLLASRHPHVDPLIDGA